MVTADKRLTPAGATARPLAGDVHDPRSLSSWFRRKRNRLLRSFILAERGNRCGSFRILDIGGSASYWQQVGTDFLEDHNIAITCVNSVLSNEIGCTPYVTEQLGDGRCLQFADMSFDMVHSNSVIEHVGRSPDMRRFADEVRRLAPAHYVQTPNFWFPIDPHFYRVPLFHWLPQPVRVALVQNVRVGLGPPIPEFERALKYVEFAVPLDRRHFAVLFPDSRICDERFLLFTKSLIALRGSSFGRSK
jgi:hypothetical protein